MLLRNLRHAKGITIAPHGWLFGASPATMGVHAITPPRPTRAAR